jgi:hypothetical protein
MSEDIRQIAAASPEHIEITIKWIALQLFLDLESEAAHAASHVRMASGDPDTTPDWQRDHDRRAFNVGAIR